MGEMTDSNTPALLKRSDLKQFYGIPEGSIGHYTRTANLPLPVKLGKRALWKREEMDAWIQTLNPAQAV